MRHIIVGCGSAAHGRGELEEARRLGLFPGVCVHVIGFVDAAGCGAQATAFDYDRSIHHTVESHKQVALDVFDKSDVTWDFQASHAPDLDAFTHAIRRYGRGCVIVTSLAGRHIRRERSWMRLCRRLQCRLVIVDCADHIEA